MGDLEKTINASSCCELERLDPNSELECEGCRVAPCYNTLFLLNWLHISLFATGTDCTMMQPLPVPLPSTQIEEERYCYEERTTPIHPCRRDCFGMNTKDEVQFTRSENLSCAPFLLQNCTRRWHVEKIKEEKAKGKWQRDIRKSEGGRKTGGRRKRRERERGCCDRQRRAEEGKKMKGNLIDEKEEQEKGVAVRERSTLETRKCRAAPSEKRQGFQGPALMRKS